MSGFRNRALAGSMMAVLATALPRSTAASTCGAFEYGVVPGPLGVVPRNARVWVTLPVGWHDTGTCRDTEERSCPRAAHRLVLRTAASGRDVPTVVEESRGDRDQVLQVGAAAPLDPETRYEIWLVAKGAGERVLGTFRTSREVDLVPPSWSKRVRVVEVRGVTPPTPPKPGSVVIQLSDSLALEPPYVVLDIDLPVDRESPHTAFRVRFSDERVASDPSGSASADTLVPMSRSALPRADITLGGNLVPCTYSTLALPRRAARLKLVIEAIDIAGNRSGEVTLSVAMPP